MSRKLIIRLAVIVSLAATVVLSIALLSRTESQSQTYQERHEALWARIFQIQAKIEVKIAESEAEPDFNFDAYKRWLPLTKQKLALLKEVNGLPRGYLYGETIYQRSGITDKCRSGLFHAVTPWAIIMEGEGLAIEIYAQPSFKMAHNTRCSTTRAESDLYQPGDYELFITPHGDDHPKDATWSVTVKQVLGVE